MQRCQSGHTPKMNKSFSGTPRIFDRSFLRRKMQRCQSGLTPKPTSLLSGAPRIFDRSTSKKNAEVSERPYPKTNFVAFGGPTNIRPLDFEEKCRGVRAAECARLESVCSESYLGFESRPLRQIKQGEKNERTNFYWRGMAICKQLVACRSLGSAFARRYFGKILSSKRCRSHVCVWF